MVLGLLFTSAYIIYFKFINPAANVPENWFLGISPEGIGTLGMVINFVVAIVVSLVTKAPPQEVQTLVDRVRFPRRAFQEESES